MPYLGTTALVEATTIADGTIVNADVANAAAIAQSKLANIVNADVDASAAIVQSKLVNIVNADVDGSAAIVTSKLSGAVTSIASHGLAASATTDATNAGNISSGTLPVARGGIGTTTLTDGGILLGSGTSAITPMAVLADSEMIVGDGTTDPVAESGATLRSSIGVGTGDSPQFTALNVGAASDTTLARASAGNLTVEGNAIYRAGGTDVPVADGGTGASTHTANNLLVGAGTSAITSVAPGADGQVLTSTGSVWQSEAAAGGGAWSVLNSGTITTQSTLNIALSTSKPCIVYLYKVHQSVNGDFKMRTSQDGGSSYDSGWNDYCVQHVYAQGGNGPTVVNNNNMDHISIFYPYTNAAATNDLSIIIEAYNAFDTVAHTALIINFNAMVSTDLARQKAFGMRKAAEEVTHIQIFNDEGGTVSCLYKVVELG